MIVIKPLGGLANRLRAIDSAIALKYDKNVNLIVFWIQNSECNSKFSDLLVVPDEINWLIEIKPGIIAKSLRRISKKYFSKPPNLFLDNKRTRDLKDHRKSTFDRRLSPLNNLQKHSSIFIETCYGFYSSSSYTPYTSLIPKEPVQKIIDKYDNSKKIGVHIRRTDNEKSITHSPIETFIKNMNSEIVTDKDVKFFLTTDDPTVKKDLFAMFPNRIETRPIRSYDRNDPIAIQDAIIDLFCLANCRKILGSYWSSFTEVAAEIYKTDIEIIYVEKI